MLFASVLRTPPILALAVLAGALPGPTAAQAPDLDIVLANGRVIDPESGLDAPRQVGIRGASIMAVSEKPLEPRLRPGGTRLDVTGLVVAPGFIDLHAHGQSARANEFQAHDGVTTALELEWGFPQVARWLASRAGKARINYGVSVSHGSLRTLLLPALGPRAAAELAAVTGDFDVLLSPPPASALVLGRREPLADDRLPALREGIEQGLREGGLGIGMAHEYYPGADRREIFRVFEMAAALGAPIFTHVRSLGMDPMQEVIADAAATGASLHIVHVNSKSQDQLPVVLDLIAGCQRRGLDVTTEAYPYTAGSTSIQSAIFDEGWRERLGIDYGDLQWQATRERLTAESFARYRQQGGVVIVHNMKEAMIELCMRTPFVMVASDGMPYAPGAHPRSAGTFSRVLARYVRERGVLSLMEALRKMTVMPARRLEGVAPSMKNKGRLREGADADITVFDPTSVRDTASFETDLSFSEGIRHVLVAGTLVVRDGATVAGAFPGRAILGEKGPRR
jgi:cytosine/adenosine deaminase-related metal-dependent hydrolase